jgi:ABC-type uncharacterized transport system substrate-binding protein
MKNRLLFKAICITIFTVFSQYSMAMEKNIYSSLPKTNQGNKWRVAYFEGGEYENYYKYLSGTILGLMEFGWIEKAEIPKFKEETTKNLWNWLTNKNSSKYIEFLKDGFYNSRWDEEERKKNKTAIIQRSNQKKDIDLIIGMGTWAGVDLANNEHSTPTIIMSTSDPVGSGIISSIDDSGFDHVHARVDPYRYERQVKIFNDLIKFKKLGIAYEDTIEGKSYAAIGSVEKVAREKGFEIIRCYTKSDTTDQSSAERSFVGCFKEMISKGADAIYVTVQGGVNQNTIPIVVKEAISNKIPTFSQFGSKEVKYGILLSISRSGDFKPAGRFFASVIGQIFNNAKPRKINQKFEEDQKLAINLMTAEKIGLYLQADILAAADEFYQEIESP